MSTRKKKNLQLFSTKIHPIFLSFLKKDVKKKYFQSINHGINAMIFAGYKKRMTAKQIAKVRAIIFGGGISKKGKRKIAPKKL